MAFRPTDRAEVLAIAVIALAVAVGGVPLLVSISHAGPLAIVALGMLAVFQVAILRRDYAAAGAASRLLVSRDITFLVAIVAAVAFVAHPARWAYGATIAATEFGLVLEVLTRVGPRDAEPPAAPAGTSPS